MASEMFGAKVDGTTILLSGVVDRAAKLAFEAAFGEVDGSSVTFDFSEVTYINSTGIAVIVGLLAQARADGVGVSAVGLSPHYREVFRITRLADFMTIEGEAANSSSG